MRGSTASGINNSLLPRDCRCGGFAWWEFAGGAVWEKASFLWHSCGFADGAIQEDVSFFWCLSNFR